MKLKPTEHGRRPKAVELLGVEKDQKKEIEINPIFGEELFRQKEEMERLMSERPPLYNEIVNYLFLCVALTQAFPDDPRGWERPENFQQRLWVNIQADQASLQADNWSMSSMNLATWTRMLTIIEPLLELDPTQGQALVGTSADWQIAPDDLPKHLAFLAHERVQKSNWRSIVSGAKTLAQLFPQIKPQMQILVRESWPEILASVKDVYDNRPVADALLLVPDLRQSLEQDPTFMQKIKDLSLREMEHTHKMLPRQIMNYQIIAADGVYKDPDGKLRITAKAKPVSEGRPLPERSQVEL